MFLIFSTRGSKCFLVQYQLVFYFFFYFADRASQYVYLNINQLDALNFIMSLFHACKCFEHMCLSSGGQNCIIQPLVSSHSVGCLPVHNLCTGRPPRTVTFTVHTARVPAPHNHSHHMRQCTLLFS